MSYLPISDGELDVLFRLLQGRPALCLAVSGGADSTALMHLAARWRSNRVDAPALTVVTVDHGLRPELESEARQVAHAARALGLPCDILNWRGSKRATGLQAAARAARYDLLAAHAQARGLSAIVTAHHLDDQAETVLMRLARGSGVDGLAAMAAESDWPGVTILRPLLDVPKTRLVATLQAEGITWFDDASNRDLRFERNRVRAVLAAVGFGLRAEALGLTAKRLRRARDALERGTEGFLSAHVRLHEAGYCRLPIRSLAAAPEEIALRALTRILAAIGGQGTPPRQVRLESLLSWLRASANTYRGGTLAGCRLVTVGSDLLIMREWGRRGLPELRLAPGACALWDRRFRVCADAGLIQEVTVRALSPAGLRQVLGMRPQAVRPPCGSGAALVSFWRGQEVVAVPHLGFAADKGCDTQALHAEFVNGRLLAAGPATGVRP